MFKNLVLGFIILCSISFYNPIGLETPIKFIQLMGIGLIIALFFMYSIYDSSIRIRKNFSAYIFIILLSLPGSMMIAAYFHGQSLGLTAYEQRDMYYYLLYFLLPILKPRVEDIQRLFFVFGITYVLLYIAQFILYPTMILDVSVLEDRGTIRISVPGVTYLLISYFLSLFILLNTQRWSYLIYCLVVLIITVLMGGRQILFFTLFLTVGILILSKKIQSKIVLSLLILIGIIPIFFLFQDIFNGIMVASQKSQSQGMEDVRIRAVLFFLHEAFPNKLAYLLGNGIPNNRSDYGRTMSMYGTALGFFRGDIGIVGNYICYGILFVIGVILLLIKILKIKIETNLKYLKHFFIMICGMILFGTGFQESEFIVALCLCLYLMDVSVMNIHMQANTTS